MGELKMENTFAFSWDWKETPDFEAIAEAWNKIAMAGLPPVKYNIDTGSDEYGLLLSSKQDLTAADAYKQWHELIYENEEEDPELVEVGYVKKVDNKGLQFDLEAIDDKFLQIEDGKATIRRIGIVITDVPPNEYGISKGTKMLM
ncbi:MAG: hypothetical protein CL843_16340 [Crocinitomicaceae bacterium]|nr:hypothetical protein [Crocinitomicaceae bacterium]|tara:strand:- start:3978 stop:4412 length:435 start_codon:yes stop_codon:yes gene_type:complete